MDDLFFSRTRDRVWFADRLGAKSGGALTAFYAIPSGGKRNPVLLGIRDFETRGTFLAMRTLSLFPHDPKPRLVHKDQVGGRKSARHLPRQRPIHLILSSRYILLTHRSWIEGKIRAYAQRFGIRVYRYAICGDHLHFAIEIPHMDYYTKFIRSLTGVVARKMGRGIWKLLPFTRIASWGADFRNLLLYIEKNRDETAILRKYEPRARDGARKEKSPPAVLSPKAKSGLGGRLLF